MLVFASLPLSLNAQSTQPKLEGSSLSLTLNPSFFILGGYSVKLLYHRPQRWTFGLAAEANFELPTFARDQFFEVDEGLTVDWNYLFGGEVRYRFNESEIDKGFHLLGTLGYEGWTVREGDQASDDFSNWYASLGLGYNWYPFKKPHFHLGASYNVVFILNNTDTRTVGQSEYRIRSIVPPSWAPNLYVGWRF